MNHNIESKEKWRRQSFAAELLSFCLRTTEVPDWIDWLSDEPRVRGKSYANGCPAADADPNAQSAVCEFALQRLTHGSTQTERRRWIEQQFHSTGARRFNLIRNIASNHIVFDGISPSVKLESFRSWRTVCHFNDEELLVAVAISAHINEHYEDGLLNKPKDLISLAKQYVQSWPVHLRPHGNDVKELLLGFENDGHVHYGQLLPSSAFWRLLMQGIYEPSKRIDGTGEIESVGPKWIIENYLKWREYRSALWTCWNDWTGGLWKKECCQTQFSGITSTDPPKWEDVQIEIAGFLERFLAEERMLLVCTSYVAKFDSRVAEFFWPYATARSTFSWEQIPRESGFEAFVRTNDIDRRKGFLWGKAGGVDVWFQLVIGWLASCGVTRLAVRQDVSDDKQEKTSTLALVGEYFDRFETARENLKSIYEIPDIEFNVVLSFNRRQGDHWASSYCRRHKDWRKTRSAVQTRQKNWQKSSSYCDQDKKSGVKKTVTAVDAISNEYGFDVGILAPPFNGFRQISDRDFDNIVLGNSAGFQFERPPALARYYHSGEDLEHPVSALRNIHEAITFLNMDSSDRIGHGSVLLRTPEDYDADESLGERLDNLVAIWSILSRLKSTHSCPLLQDELLQIHNLLHEANGLRLTLHELVEAWLLRYHSEECIIPRFLGRPHILGAYFGYALLPDTSIGDHLHGTELENWHAVRDDLSGVVEQIYELRAKPISGHYKGEWWRSLLDSVVSDIKRAGVVIETCPSSNLTIGAGWTGELPALGLFNLGLEHNLLVGTDDPKMFKTDLVTEVSLVLEALSRNMGRRKAIAQMEATLLSTQR